MKQILFKGLALTALSILAVSCSDNNPWGPTNEGHILPKLALDENPITSESASQKARAAAQVSVSDLQITLSKDDGTYTHSWASVNDFPVDESFPIGKYTMEASYGDANTEGFECPYFYGSTPVIVTEGETTDVALTATLANTMLSIEYTDAFKKYMTAWSTMAHADGGEHITFLPNETRPAYLRPGNVTVNVSFTKPNGKSATLEMANFTALARHHYHLTIDVNNGQVGDAILILTFDDMLNQEDVVIELSDELMDAPAPTLSPVGFTDGQTIQLVECFDAPQALKFNIIAKGGLKSANLTSRSSALIKSGWPTEINLLEATAAEQGIMKAMGLETYGVWGVTDKMAVIDVSKLSSHIEYNPAGNNTTTLTLVAKDNLMKVSEPVTINLEVTPMTLEISNPSALNFGDTQLQFTLKFNGPDADKNVQVMLRNALGIANAVKPTSLEAKGEGTYLVTIPVPADNKPVSVFVKAATKTSNEITVVRNTPSFSVAANNDATWSNRTTLEMTSNEIDDNYLASITNIYLSTDGSNFSAKQATYNKGTNTLSVTGLTPATKYYVKASVTGKEDDTNATCTFTTESPLDVPNGDFEDLVATISANGMLQGGKWSISAGINYDNKMSYSISEPRGWASVNAKTASNKHANQNTWFVVPSTFNSTLTCSSTVPNIRVMNTGGGTETPQSYTGFTAHSGANAMVVRNVSWDANGTTPGVWKKEFASASEYYNHDVPQIANNSAGKLFLGSYAYSNGTETYNEGVAFTSRPSKLTGYYTYNADSQTPNEKGIVTVEIMNGNTVIGTGTALLSATGSYHQFEIAITYIQNAPKATDLRIMIASSDKASKNQAQETASILTSVYNYRYESAKHGSTLTIDNLKFSY